jgi:hypothetical protein
LCFGRFPSNKVALFQKEYTVLRAVSDISSITGGNNILVMNYINNLMTCLSLVHHYDDAFHPMHPRVVYYVV